MVRQAIYQFIKDLLNKHLQKVNNRNLQEGRLEVLRVAGGGWLANSPHTLPLEITTRGPRDLSERALELILQALRDNANELIWFLMQLEYPKRDGANPFRIVQFEVEEYGASIVLQNTVPPSASPDPVEAMTDEKEVGLPWWVWLVVGVVLLLVSCCICWACLRSSKGKGRDEVATTHETRMLWSTRREAPSRFRQSITSAVPRGRRRPERAERQKSVAKRAPQRAPSRKGQESARRGGARGAQSRIRQSITSAIPLGRHRRETAECYTDMYGTDDAAEEVFVARKAERRTSKQQARQELERHGRKQKPALDPTMFSSNQVEEATAARRARRRALKKQARKESKRCLAITNGSDGDAKKGLEPEETATEQSLSKNQAREKKRLALMNGGNGDSRRSSDPEGSRSTDVARRIKSGRRRITLTDRFKQSVSWIAGKDPEEETYSDNSGKSSDESEGGDANKPALLAIEPEGKSAEEALKEAKKHQVEPQALLAIEPAKDDDHVTNDNRNRPRRSSRDVDLARRPSRLTDRLKMSFMWMTGRDPAEDDDSYPHDSRAEGTRKEDHKSHGKRYNGCKKPSPQNQGVFGYTVADQSPRERLTGMLKRSAFWTSSRLDNYENSGSDDDYWSANESRDNHVAIEFGEGSTSEEERKEAKKKHMKKKHTKKKHMKTKHMKEKAL